LWRGGCRQLSGLSIRNGRFKNEQKHLN
jgi:hypothetical protein